jgi:Copper amine oxidase, enzyme domain
LSTNGNDSNNKIVVKMVPFGPNTRNINSLTSKLLSRPRVRSHLKSIREGELEGKKNKKTNIQSSRLLSFELLPEAINPVTISKRDTLLPKNYLAKYYDYENNRCLTVKGKLGQPNPTEVIESKQQPLPNTEEFEEAAEILRQNEPSIAEAIQNNILKLYRPMPPLFIQETSDGDIERTLCIGLRPTDIISNSSSSSKHQHEIMAVNMIQKSVVRFDSRAPENSRAEESLCGSPDAYQPTTDRGTPGSAKVTVKQGNKLLWDFVVTRPAASSGTNGSGIELQYVNYKGKRVLRRANVPILNVKYDDDACGPYRDWQYQEGMIEANGNDVAAGFRLCPSAAKTVLDSGNDQGNFLGVAVYVDTGQQEVVLVSEMEAGWYRYISEWRLHVNGTIKPRFGFDAVNNSCVCNTHHHHVYWRLNFDVGNSKKNMVEEYNNPPLAGRQSNWHTIKYETRRLKNPSSNRKWRIKNQQTGKGYMISPGANDGIADSFGRGDIWFLRNRPNQFDDGVEAIGPPYEALIDNFVNHELIKNKDVVVWYGAHFTHTTKHDDDAPAGHIVGPDLRPLDLQE